MKQANVERPWINGGKSGNQVLPNLPLRVADSVDDSAIRIIQEDRDPFHFSAKTVASLWEIKLGLPSIKRVVVTVADERSYAGLAEPVQTIDKLELGPEASVGAVKHVPGNQKRAGPLPDAQVDYVAVGGEGGVE
jgi:hypothetical protein